MATTLPPYGELYVETGSDGLHHPDDDGALLVAPDGRKLRVSAESYAVLERVLDQLQRGRAVQLVVYDRELTTRQAADLLNISRQYLVRLLESGKIPFSKVGTHRRVQLEDVLSYRRQRSRERRESLARLTRASQEMGDY